MIAPATTLVIEADGSQHLKPEHVMADKARDTFLLTRSVFCAADKTINGRTNESARNRRNPEEPQLS